MSSKQPIRQPETKAPYYAQGRVIFHRPEKGMAFPVCTVNQFVEAEEGELPPAAQIAAELSAYPALLAKAEALDKLAEALGEADDPFAARETLALLVSEHRTLRAALKLLSFEAQISGGTPGENKTLQSAIDIAGRALANIPDRQELQP